MKDKDFTDLIIWIAECLKSVDGINIEWRVLYKYATDFLNDNCLKVEIKKNKEGLTFLKKNKDGTYSYKI